MDVITRPSHMGIPVGGNLHFLGKVGWGPTLMVSTQLPINSVLFANRLKYSTWSIIIMARGKHVLGTNMKWMHG